MKIQTRISLTFFVVLLGFSAATSLVVRRSLTQALDVQADVGSGVAGKALELEARGRAFLGARALEGALDGRLQAIRARGEVMSRVPMVVNSLATPGSGLGDALGQFLGKSRGELTFLQVVGLDGSLVLPAGAASRSLGTGLEKLREEAAKGETVSGYELLLPAVLGALTGEGSSGVTGGQLVQVAVVPVKSGDGKVLGLVVAGRGLEDLQQVLVDWQKRLDLADSAAALLQGPHRVSVVGAGLVAGGALAAADWQALSSQRTQLLAEPTGAVVRLGLANGRDELLGALEVRAPLRSSPPGEARGPVAAVLDGLVRDAFSMVAGLGVLALVLGILAMRSVAVRLARVNRRAEAVSTGQLEESLKDLVSKDEIGELVGSLERLRISLKKLMDRQK